MIYNKKLHMQIIATSHALRSGGPVTAILKALNGIPTHMGKSLVGHESMPDFVTDLLASLGVSPLEGVGARELNVWDHERKILPTPETKADEKSGGQFLTKSFTNHAGTRNYKVYIPTSYQGGAVPVLVMLHGCTQNPDDFARGTRMNAVAEEKKCLVVYPAQSQSANSFKCWNWFNADNQQRDQGEPSIIAGITHQVICDYQLDCKRVYIAGLSSGGAMAIIMGTTYPELYAAVGVHSGLPYGSAQDLPSAFATMRGAKEKSRTFDSNPPLRSIPIIVFHGDNDMTVHSSNADQLIKQNVSPEKVGSGRMDHKTIVKEGTVTNGHNYTQTLHQDEFSGCPKHILINYSCTTRSNNVQ